MATKEEVLQYIRTLAERSIITRDELTDAYDSGIPHHKKGDITLRKKLGIAEILYYIGGGIVVMGIAILLGQNWGVLNFGTKVLATLGSGIAAYIVGLLFSQREHTEPVGIAFYLISALVTPIGLGVVFHNAGYNVGSYGVQSAIAGTLLVTYLLSLFILKKNIFTLFSVLFGTWLFFSVTSWMVGSAPIFIDWKFFMYRVLIIGATYMLIGYSFSKNERSALSGFLYGFGVIGFLGAALVLGGWKPNQNVFWELVYPLLVFGALFLSVHIKSKAFLTWGTIFLMLYILKITSEYFSTGLGWPLALIIAGLAMIGAGYMSLAIKKKYLPNQ